MRCFADSLKLLEVNIGTNSALATWSTNLKVVSDFYYTRTYVPKSKFNVALKVVRKDFDLNCLDFIIEFPALWSMIADCIENLVNQLVDNHLSNPQPSSPGLVRLYDLSGSLFVVDETVLRPFKGSVIDFTIHLKGVAKVLRKLSRELPRYLRFLRSRKDFVAFPAIFDRSLVCLPDDFAPKHLRLTKPALKLHPSMSLVARFNRVSKLVLSHAKKTRTWIWGIYLYRYAYLVFHVTRQRCWRRKEGCHSPFSLFVHPLSLVRRTDTERSPSEAE